MRSRRLRYRLKIISLGARLCCPRCGAKSLFSGFFTLRATCLYCQSRFERSPGDAYGGVYVNLLVSEVLSLTGFFFSQEFTQIATELLLIFWLLFSLVFMLLFYRHARGIWIAIRYLTGGVYPDPDYEREYIHPANAADIAEPRSPERE